MTVLGIDYVFLSNLEKKNVMHISVSTSILPIAGLFFVFAIFLPFWNKYESEYKNKE